MDENQKKPPQDQVFINFRGAELRGNFIRHLERALNDQEINVFIDANEKKGEVLKNLFKRIEQSRIALAVFSTRYTESTWCLDELVKIKECFDRRVLKVIPIFYNVSTSDVKNLTGKFGQNFKRTVYKYRSDMWMTYEPRKIDEIVEVWENTVKFVADINGFPFDEKSDEVKEIESIVETVSKLLEDISLDNRRRDKILETNTGGSSSLYVANKREPRRRESEEYLTSFRSVPDFYGSNSLAPRANIRSVSSVPSAYEFSRFENPHQRNMDIQISKAEAMINQIRSNTQQPFYTGRSNPCPSGPRNNATSRVTKSRSQVECMAYASSHTAQDGQGHIICTSSSSINSDPFSSNRHMSYAYANAPR